MFNGKRRPVEFNKTLLIVWCTGIRRPLAGGPRQVGPTGGGEREAGGPHVRSGQRLQGQDGPVLAAGIWCSRKRRPVVVGGKGRQ